MAYATTRASSDEQRLTLKTAFRLLLRQVGKLDYIAGAVTRLTPGSMSKAGNPQEDYYPPLDAILDLEIAAGRPVVTEALARLQGYRLEVMADAGEVDLMQESTAATAKLGAWAGAVMAAMADGSLTHAERVSLRTQARDIIDQWQSLHDRLARVATGGGI
ncbi:MAG: hypothetical protein DCC73_14905 [Proteobacteria bacterium]|nr:MAG: hypothetical protein DCC73_14905 [Pseudomonadota bacterium]